MAWQKIKYDKNKDFETGWRIGYGAGEEHQKTKSEVKIAKLMAVIANLKMRKK